MSCKVDIGSLSCQNTLISSGVDDLHLTPLEWSFLSNLSLICRGLMSFSPLTLSASWLGFLQGKSFQKVQVTPQNPSAGLRYPRHTEGKNNYHYNFRKSRQSPFDLLLVVTPFGNPLRVNVLLLTTLSEADFPTENLSVGPGHTRKP